MIPLDNIKSLEAQCCLNKHTTTSTVQCIIAVNVIQMFFVLDSVKTCIMVKTIIMILLDDIKSYHDTVIS